MYRYRDQSGSTRRSLQMAERHLPKIGKVLSIKGYRYKGRYDATHESVMVKGENGSCRFDGFCWGYGGTGPHGLFDLLTRLGIIERDAKAIAFECFRGEEIGVDWSVEFRTDHYRMERKRANNGVHISFRYAFRQAA